jgi:hypothetical protein
MVCPKTGEEANLHSIGLVLGEGELDGEVHAAGTDVALHAIGVRVHQTLQLALKVTRKIVWGNAFDLCRHPEPTVNLIRPHVHQNFIPSGAPRLVVACISSQDVPLWRIHFTGFWVL